MCCSAIPRKFCSGVLPPAKGQTTVQTNSKAAKKTKQNKKLFFYNNEKKPGAHYLHRSCPESYFPLYWMNSRRGYFSHHEEALKHHRESRVNLKCCRWFGRCELNTSDDEQKGEETFISAPFRSPPLKLILSCSICIKENTVNRMILMIKR